MKLIKFCYKFIFKNKKMFIFYLLISLIYSISGLILPLINGSIIDDLIINKSYNSLLKLCILIFVINIFMIILNYINNRLYVKIQSVATYEMNMYILKHVKKIPFSFIQNQNSIYLNEKINSDCNHLTNFFILLFSNSMINILTLFFSLSFLIKFNNKLTIILVIIIFLYLFIYNSLKQIIFKESLNAKEARSKKQVFF